ncbi:hypothetical protein GWC77_25685 [Paraburkholderia sp. NMBU_R16]|uniref:hypothetical protein n=1 Tax=Paraburkholderia sp. NMBU_R16 TaxID=2698676 RepID=UPI00156514FF|nr:hypothetical protein [Paraburkholderia sp. NMBU_R16]NRO99285.1 hypothetical protein [Paraburkholderia sp. NMBU_R16]
MSPLHGVIMYARHVGDATIDAPGETMPRLSGFLTILASMLLSATTGAVQADQLSRSVTTSGLTVHFGVMPAEKARSVDRGASAPEESTSGSVHATYHLVVALVDKSTGERIDGATVTAKMTSPSHKTRTRTQVKPLQEMRINDTVTYGNYFDMPWQGRYRIDLSVKRKDRSEPIHARLNYDHHF